MDIDDTMIDVDNLAKKIESRLLELDGRKKLSPPKKEIDQTITDFGELFDAIEKKIKEIEAYEKIDVNINNIADKVNNKLNNMMTFHDERDLDQTLYNLEEVSQIINDTIKKIDTEKKKKKAKKAKYCELARKTALKNKGGNQKVKK